MKAFARIPLALTALALFSASCTVVSVDSRGRPPRIESNGLVDGHAAVGLPAEDRIFHAELFGGESRGAVAQVVVWKLFRLELGLAGASVGVGPFDLGLGVLAYDPRLPDYVERREGHAEHEREPTPPETPQPAEVPR